MNGAVSASLSLAYRYGPVASEKRIEQRLRELMLVRPYRFRIPMRDGSNRAFANSDVAYSERQRDLLDYSVSNPEFASFSVCKRVYSRGEEELWSADSEQHAVPPPRFRCHLSQNGIALSLPSGSAVLDHDCSTNDCTILLSRQQSTKCTAMQ